jgi:hypothetical protein
MGKMACFRLVPQRAVSEDIRLLHDGTAFARLAFARLGGGY